MNALIQRVDAFIRRHRLLQSDEPVVVGISGGADSIVLASILLELGHPLTAVHVNFLLRAAASDADEAFVRSWCRERQIDLDVRSFDTATLSDERGASVQETARILRYDAFETTARRAGIRRVALGHHRDDQAETLLLNLFRGTGPEGLAGMPVRRAVRPGSEVEIVRPLLGLRRREIEEHARSAGLAWREDASNTNPKYRRGALRGEIIPLVERHFGEAVVENVARSADLVRDYLEHSLAEDLEAAFSAALSTLDGMGAVDLEAVRQMPAILRRRVYIEALRRWLPSAEANAQTAAEIDRLADSQPGRRLEFGAGSVWRERRRLLFAPERNVDELDVRLLEEGSSVHLPGAVLRADVLPHPPRDPSEHAPYEVYLDARFVRFPLTVRAWRAGDRFEPLGMTGSKKVSDFLADERVAPHRKQYVPVVESEGRIVWVVPLRIAEAVRLRDDTAETVRLRYRAHENTNDRAS